jgi:hypothetical protein
MKDYEIKIETSLLSRYLLEKAGISDRDKNALPSVVKLIKSYTFRGFLAQSKIRELRCPTNSAKSP